MAGKATGGSRQPPSKYYQVTYCQDKDESSIGAINSCNLCIDKKIKKRLLHYNFSLSNICREGLGRGKGRRREGRAVLDEREEERAEG